jgi:hypothetical protein
VNDNFGQKAHRRVERERSGEGHVHVAREDDQHIGDHDDRTEERRRFEHADPALGSTLAHHGEARPSENRGELRSTDARRGAETASGGSSPKTLSNVGSPSRTRSLTSASIPSDRNPDTRNADIEGAGSARGDLGMGFRAWSLATQHEPDREGR